MWSDVTGTVGDVKYCIRKEQTDEVSYVIQEIVFDLGFIHL